MSYRHTESLISGMLILRERMTPDDWKGLSAPLTLTLSNLLELSTEASQEFDVVEKRQFDLPGSNHTVLIDATDQHEPGAKMDNGKLLPALVLGGFAKALMAVALVGTDGAIKYTPNGWIFVENGVERYREAHLRHLFAALGGEVYDPDSKTAHLAHIAWNALAELELEIRDGFTVKLIDYE